MEGFQEQAKSAQVALDSLSQLQSLMTLQPLMRGECEGFPSMEAQASDGDATNQYFVGIAFLYGWCVSQDFERGLNWLARSASGGYDQAAVDYASSVFGKVESGEQVAREKQTRAVELLKEAADRSNADANLHLGFLYRDGTVVPKDTGLAETYLIKASVGGNETAVYNLGKLYLGQDDLDKARNWFLYGATKGFPISQAMSAAVLSDSTDPQDHVEAYKWANVVAASSAHDNIVQAATQIRTNLESTMTPAQIGEAQALSSAFEPNLFAEPPYGSEIEGAHQYSYDELVDPIATPEQIAAREELKAKNIPINRIAFFEAVKNDDLSLVETFIRAGASLESLAIGTDVAPQGATPLYVAVDWGAEQTYRYLMDQGVNLDAPAQETGYTPLVRALAHERYDKSREMLDAGADATMRGNPELGLITSSALGFAVGTEHADLVRRILAQGGSVEERYSSRMTPLQNAITLGGSAEVIQLLLEEGADPNAVGNYETMLDATFDFEEFTVRTDALALLLEYGADPESLERSGGTPLLAAASIGSPSAIRLLVQSGADPNRLVAMGREEIPMLYEDPIERDILVSGITPLAMAAMMGRISAATTLIEVGADTKYVVNGETGSYTMRDLADRSGVTIPGL